MCYFRAKIMKTESRTKRFFVFYAEVHLIFAFRSKDNENRGQNKTILRFLCRGASYFRILGKDTINKIKKWN